MATDFSSLDKLMEFGLGLGIATQMMNTMNTVIARTAMPGVGINPGMTATPGQEKPRVTPCEEYYVVYDEKVAGPLTEHEMSKLIREGIVGRRTFCWKPGLSSWMPAEDIPDVNKLLLLNN